MTEPLYLIYPELECLLAEEEALFLKMKVQQADELKRRIAAYEATQSIPELPLRSPYIRPRNLHNGIQWHNDYRDTTINELVRAINELHQMVLDLQEQIEELSA